MRGYLNWMTGVALFVAPGLALAAADTLPQGQSGAAAQGVPVPDATISKAGAALRDVADLQEKYQPKMDSATPKEKEGLSAQANAEAVQAIQSHGLSMQEYSSVVRMAQTNPQVRQRLLDAANQR
nr:DUF4168 domain-containing protein [uncultured Rhodopila sp.]